MTSTGIQETAKSFGNNIVKIQSISQRRKSLTESKWTSQVGQFFTKLFPVAQLALSLTTTAADVTPRQKQV
jgi:hypothetical protein